MVIPLYQSEVAPKEIRGRLVAVQVTYLIPQWLFLLSTLFLFLR
jgi:hypothetical protein